MAISLEQYAKKQQIIISQWENEADKVEKLIDDALEHSISDNIIPNPINSNFILRYKFQDNVSPEAKNILRIRYSKLGWFIKENSDFKDSMIHGYFDFYKKMPSK